MVSLTRLLFLLMVTVDAAGILSMAKAATPDAPSNLRLGGAPEAGLFAGIPHPDGMVPDAIMPTLPTAGSQIQAFPYDPINMPAPEWQDSSNQYWVDSSIACDDTNNGGRGSPEAPRCTLPGLSSGGSQTWQLDTGDHVFIVGNGETYISPDNSVSVDEMTFPGTEASPIWVIGVSDPSDPRWTNQPKLSPKRFKTGDNGVMTHTIFENIHFFAADDSFAANFGSENAIESSGYITLRQVTCSGSGTDGGFGTESTGGGNCFTFNGSSGSPTEFVVIYDSDIFGRGRWNDDFDTSRDLHGLQLNSLVRYVWYLNNRSFHLQGDSIQCSNSNQFDFNRDERPHYFYLGGNEIFENYENAFDTKGCYHVVFSENFVHDFTNEVKVANNTAITAAQDGESFVGDRFNWFVNNRFEDVGDAIAYKGTTDDAFVYIIGNLITNVLFKTTIPVESRCSTESSTGTTTCGDGMFVAMNTVDCNATSGSNIGVVRATRNGQTSDPDVPQEEQDQEINFVGNIFYNCDDQDNAVGESPHGWENINSNFIFTYNHNVDFRTFGDPIGLAPNYLEDSTTGNKTNVDPLFVNPTGTLSGDYTLQLESPVRKSVPEPSAYTLFRDMYGVDIRQDITGKVWREGSSLNAGTFQ